MQHSKVLVTGANGYIGCHVVRQLLELGYEVYASDFAFNRVDERAHQVSTPIFSGDENIYEQLGAPDICIHLAWRDGFKHNSDAHMEDLSKHFVFINNLIKGGLKHISVMGSMHEVGYWEGAIDENTPTRPLSMYGIAKNSLRQSVELLVNEHDVVCQWLRGFYIFGDDLQNNSVFSKIIQMDQKGETLFPFTSGKNKYDFISIEVLCKQIVAASIQEDVKGVINCCSGKPVSLADQVEEFIKRNGLNIRLEYGKYPDRPYDSPAVWGDNTKISLVMNSFEEKQ